MTFDELSDQEKRFYLLWMKEGLDMGAKKQVIRISYQSLLKTIKEGTPFDPKKVWESMPEGTRNHFSHTVEAMDSLEKLFPVPPASPATAPGPPRKPRMKKAKPKNKR